MKTFEQDFKTNPSFNIVTGLSNTTFDPTNVVVNRGASEGQVKYVYDLIKALQEWLDENGCSDDPYALIRQKVDELEEAIGICCANPQDTLIQMLNDRLTALQTAQEECCQVMDDSAYQALVARLTALETSMNTCCSNYEAKIEELMNNVVRISTGDDGIETVIGTNCDPGLVTVSHEPFDFSNVNAMLSGQGASSPKIGKVLYTISSQANKTIYRCAFSFAKSNGERYTGATNIISYLQAFKLEGYENVTIRIKNNVANWNSDWGNIEMIAEGTGYLNGQFPQDQNFSCSGRIVVGPNKTYSRVFLVVIDTDGCVWEEEIPLSEFNFSGVDYSLLTHYQCPPIYELHHI